MSPISFLHPLEQGSDQLPQAFTFPFRYTPHPLCVRAARMVQQKLQEIALHEGKMFGVMVGLHPDDGLCFMAAYSGQLNGSYSHPWFVPPVVDYLHPDSHFQKEQTAIVQLNKQMEALLQGEHYKKLKYNLKQLLQTRNDAIEQAKATVASSKAERKDEAYVKMRQRQKADVRRARHLLENEIREAEAALAREDARIANLAQQRKERSEALQQWLFEQFDFLNGSGEHMNLTHLFHSKGEMTIPSGAGECCAPKLLQTAYLIGLRPLAMAEFWWGPPPKNTFRREGMFYPACQRKCRPILSHMLGGLVVEADPAAHYDKVAAPVRVVWEDDAMAVVEKPTGWLSVPGKTSQPNVQEEARRRWPHAEGPLVVHRLDQDTSGLMVIAKTLQAYRQLQQQFEQRMVGKRYVALLEGSLKEEGNSHPDEGTIVLPLSAEYNDLPRQRVDHAHGAEAVTRYKVMGEEQRCGTTVTRIAFYPQTGRTHQLRLHAASPEGLGHPIVGDRLYGHVDVRLLLHAERIELHHPATQALLHFECPCPF